MKNIVLIGLPASGKTTVGRLTAAQMGRPFLDTDEAVARREGKSIPAIFAEKGEAHFRALEHDCVLAAAAEQGAVIAAGGGVVLDETCMRALKKGGMVFYLDRPISEIVAAVMEDPTRPLLRGDAGRLLEMQKQRQALYRRYADYTITGGTPEEISETVQLMVEMTCED